MLLIKGVQPGPEGQLLLDDLVVKADWGEAGDFQVPRYWRIGDFHQSLLEVGLDPGTGRLLSVTLVIAPQIQDWQNGSQPVEQIAQKMLSGIPLFDTSTWKGDDQFLDEHVEFRVMLGRERLGIEWGDRPAIVHCVQSGRVVFVADERDALYGIEFSRLSAAEVTTIRDLFTP